MDRSTSFFTIGHSTRTIQEFVRLLQIADIRIVIDVRTIPRSRTNPQFNQETLPASLTPGVVCHPNGTLTYPPPP